MSAVVHYFQRLKRNSALKQISSYGVLTLLQKGTGFIMLPFTTRYLSLAEYGLLESVILVLLLCSLLEVSAGALPKMAADTPEPEHGRLLASALSLSALVGIGLALAVALLLTVAPLSLFAALGAGEITAIGLTVWLMITLQPLMMWLRVKNRAGYYSLLVGLQTLLQALGTLWVLQQGYGVSGVLWVSAAAHSLSLLFALLLLYQDYLWLPQWRVICATFSYQSCLIWASLALFVTHGLDRLLLGQWLGAEALARYGILMKVVEVVAVVFAVVESWWCARRFAVLKERGGEQKVLKTHLLMLYLIAFLLLGCALLAPLLLTALLPAAYVAQIIWLPLMLSAVGLKLMTAIFDMGCYLAAKPVWLSRVNWCCAALAALLYLLLIPALGVWGLLLALNLVYGVRLIIFFYLSQKALPLAYPGAEIAALIIPVGLGLGVQLLPVESLVQVVVTLIAMLLLSLALIHRLMPQRELWHFSERA